MKHRVYESHRKPHRIGLFRTVFNMSNGNVSWTANWEGVIPKYNIFFNLQEVTDTHQFTKIIYFMNQPSIASIGTASKIWIVTQHNRFRRLASAIYRGDRWIIEIRKISIFVRSIVDAQAASHSDMYVWAMFKIPNNKQLNVSTKKQSSECIDENASNKQKTRLRLRQLPICVLLSYRYYIHAAYQMPVRLAST